MGRGAAKLTGEGKEKSLDDRLVTQPARSPDLVLNALGCSASLRSRVSRERLGTIGDFVEGVRRLFGEEGSATPEGGGGGSVQEGQPGVWRA